MTSISQVPQGPEAPMMARVPSATYETKADVEQNEYPVAPSKNVAAEDNDQVGYATFMAARERGYVPVSAVTSGQRR